MISCVTPSNYYIEETLLTLKYAGTTMKITNTPAIQGNQEDRKLNDLISENNFLRQENNKLKEKLSSIVY